jgi:hypothetical protein
MHLNTTRDAKLREHLKHLLTPFTKALDQIWTMITPKLLVQINVLSEENQET